MSDEAEKSKTGWFSAPALTRADVALATGAFAVTLIAGLVVVNWQESGQVLSEPGAFIAALIFLAYGFNRRGVVLRALFRWNACLAHRAGALRAKRLRWTYVVDGDTLDDALTGVRYRLVNIDAPETGWRARSAAERRLGAIAKNVARKLVRDSTLVEVRPTGKIDRYGRVVSNVVLDGRDLGQILMSRRLARPWHGQRESWTDPNGRLRI